MATLPEARRRYPRRAVAAVMFVAFLSGLLLVQFAEAQPPPAPATTLR